MLPLFPHSWNSKKIPCQTQSQQWNINQNHNVHRKLNLHQFMLATSAFFSLKKRKRHQINLDIINTVDYLRNYDPLVGVECNYAYCKSSWMKSWHCHSLDRSNHLPSDYLQLPRIRLSSLDVITKISETSNLGPVE